ncbi:DUF6282 family protein [Consotaella salsifontis]|uniref:Amidohydrolase-related domain-containing protein n=1 Tax=Consotaella salsifontis TaxID=1365950 RepID=A0A1T4TC13_9HYPH|nr:DUF6282 family protein [Consotaella salsifontis]SKA38055.1 hypothetical protein SAMN05428963_12413 [Consotaella salsifontis]
MNTATDPRDAEVEELLVGAVDLHCHSGPAAMPRILDHHEALLDAAEAGFRALLYKDHFYLGVAHAVMLEKLVPNTGVRLYSGIALNNASGGINPHAVNHAANIGAKIVWLPTLSAANHVAQTESGAKNFPKTAKRMLEPIPLSALDANGAITDDTKLVLDIVAEADMILAGGHLPAREIIQVFEEAGRRGVKRMLVNHPTYVVNCTDDDMRALVELGAYLEHSICMFIPGKALCFTQQDLAHYIELAGAERTVLSSDLGLQGSPRPIEGYRQIVRMLLDMQMPKQDIRRMIGDNAAWLLNIH